ncbi:MAG: ABC transporter ATP-binding protein [Bacillota bacterium]|nr:ABC transporter ATP-binding protein [Bacillota bacterium]
MTPDAAFGLPGGQSDAGRVPRDSLLWLTIRRCGPFYAAHTAFWVLNMFGPLVPGLLIRLLFDSLQGKGGLAFDARTLVAALFAVALTRAALLVAAGPVDITRSLFTMALYWRNMLGRILDLPGAAALRVTAGDVTSRFRDDAGDVEDFLSNIPDILGAFGSSVAALAILSRIDSTLALIVFIPLMAVVATSQAAGLLLERYRRASREATARVTGAISEAFGAITAIKLNTAESHVSAHFASLGADRRRAVLNDRRVTLLLELLENGTAALGMGVILLAAAGVWRGRRMSVGDLTLFASYLAVVADRSVYLGSWIARYRQTGVAFERMAEILSGAPATALVARRDFYFAGRPGLEETMEGEPVIHPGARTERGTHPGVPSGAQPGPLSHLTVRNLSSLAYGLSGVSFDLERGTLTVIAGKVASGKTTVLRALLGLVPADTGSVTWNSLEVQDPAAFLTPPRSAYVSQAPVLLSDTIRANVLLGRVVPEEGLEKALYDSVLSEDIRRMERGLDTLVGPRGARLSGGQVQRVALARALAGAPELLVLDDLASALDVETERELWRRLCCLRRSSALTYLASSSRREAFLRADQIVVLTHGRVQDVGSLAALLDRCREMREIWEGGDGRQPGLGYGHTPRS